LLAGACYSDIKTTLSTRVVEWPKAFVNVAINVWPVSHTQDNRFALIALNALQILDKDPIGIIAEEYFAIVLKFGFMLRTLPKRILDGILLGCTQGDDTQGWMLFAIMLAQEVKDDVADPHGLITIPATFVVTGCDILEANPLIRAAMRAGETDQAPVVEVAIGECDQRLIGTAVMPLETSRLEVCTEALIQNALGAFLLLGLLLVFIVAIIGQ
jgi:hypothetical protein